MSIKSDAWIIEQCAYKHMIVPYLNEPIKEVNGKKVISYGVSSYGYDIRCTDKFRLIEPQTTDAVDPKEKQEKIIHDIVASGPFNLNPGECVLTGSFEYFKIPRNVLGICIGKSTYARCGIIVNITPLEPEWEGHLTIEISNTNNHPVKIYPNEGIAQLLFFESDQVCERSYKDKDGKYQGQTGVTGSRM